MNTTTGVDRILAGFSDLARHFARLVCELDGVGGRELALAAALVSREVGAGHVCADLAAHAGTPVSGPEGDRMGPGDQEGGRFPMFDEWMDRLRGSAVVGAPGEFRPMILDGRGRLYLYRYWEYERDLAQGLLERAREPLGDLDERALAAGLARLFPDRAPAEVDWQRVAAVAAATRRFAVISGGPGTGKTHTVVKVLALLIALREESSGSPAPRIALAAPTGKAAARLKEAIRRARAELPCSEAVRARIPEDVSTLHRLLGAAGSAARSRYGRDNPLPYDVVVVDEASMVDLPLMAKLVRALLPGARLVLLGDRDQLSSVEAGAVLGDICAAQGGETYSEALGALVRAAAGDVVPTDSGPDAGRELRDAVVVLQRSYRFGAESGIGVVSRAVNRGEGDAAMTHLRDSRLTDAAWREVGVGARLEREIVDRVVPHALRIAQAETPAQALQRLGASQVLCALRRGPLGAEAVNALVERALEEAGRVQRRGRWYRGRPVLVTRNDYQARLFNGDLGVAFPDPEAGGELRVFFPAADGTLRSVLPARLSEHETAYAMTVHKSQGSEFDEVVLLLGDRPSPVLTRELVYTGLTRARRRVEVWGARDAFQGAVARRAQRTSGLRDALWGAVSSPAGAPPGA